jgi:hypothetical protein
MSQGKIELRSRQVQIIDSLSTLKELNGEWSAFHCAARRQNVLHDPQQILFELKRHEERYSPLCVVVWHKGAIDCIAPFFVDISSFHLQLSTLTIFSMKARFLRLFGNDFLFKDTSDNFCYIDIVFDAINTMRERFDLISLECLETSSALWRYCCDRQKMKRVKFHSFSRVQEPDKIYRLQMATSYNEWVKSLPRKRRQTFSWQTRRFEKSVKGPIRLWGVKNESDVRPFLDVLNILFPKTWQAKAYGNRKRNSLREINYFNDLARASVLRAYMLLDGSRAVAFLIGFQYAGTYYYEEIGYDPEYAHL